MKRIFSIVAFIFIITAVGYSQGDVTSPYSTTGWDAPYGYTTHYGLPIYTLLSNPGGWINKSQKAVDSLLYALVVYTDQKQLYIRSDTLVISDSLSFQGAFTGTAQYDTTVVPGADSLDVVCATAREAVLTANDLLSVYVKQDTVIVARPASGTSGLKYNAIWIRKYQ